MEQLGGERSDSEKAMTGRSSRRNVFIGVGIAFVMAVTGFAIALSARDGGNDAASAETPSVAPTTDLPAPDASSPATEIEPVAAPVVTEIPIPIVAPIVPGDGPSGTGLPLVDTSAYEDTTFQTEAIDVLSPIVGEASIAVVADEVGPGGARAPAPPVLAAEFGLPVPDLEELLDDDREPTEVPVGPEVDLGTVERFVGIGSDPPGDGDGSESPGGDGSDSASPAADVGFVDLCAELEDEPRCPDVGEPATITETFALTTPPRFQVVITVRPTEECAAPAPDDQARVSIVSTTPIASMSLRYYRSGWVSDTSRTVTISTPDDVAEEWLDAFEMSTTDPPPPIVHCTILTDLRAGDRHQYVAEATDVFDQPWATWGTPPYFSGPEYEIPKTLLLTLSDNELLVSTPHREEQAVLIHAFRRNGEPTTGDPCTTTSRVHPGYDLPEMPEGGRTSSSSAVELSNAGFDPRYNFRTFGTMRLEEGSTYRLCIFTSVTRPSFEAGVERIETYDIVTPDALDLSFRVVEVETAGGSTIPPDTLDVVVRPTGRGIMVGHPYCGVWSNSTEISGRVVVDEPICTADAGSSALYRSGARVTLVAEDIGGGVDHRLESILRVFTCVGACIPPEPDLYRLELPTGAPRVGFGCGLFGDPCDRPSDASWGAIVIEVSYANTQGDLRSDWGISLPEELGDQRPDPPETPRFDVLALPEASGPRDRPTMTFDIVADRPVTATVTLLDPDTGGPACTRDGAAQTASFDVLAERHAVAIDNLCPQSSYAPIVELTDADGDTSRWHARGGDPAFGPGEPWVRGFLHTNHIGLDFTASISIEPPPTLAWEVERLDLELPGTRVGLIGQDFRDPTFLGECRFRTLNADAVQGGPGERTTELFLPTGLTVEIFLDVEVNVVGRRCPDVDGDLLQPGPLSLARTIAFDDIVFGEPITLTGSIAVPEQDALGDEFFSLYPDAAFDVVATVTFLGAR